MWPGPSQRGQASHSVAGPLTAWPGPSQCGWAPHSLAGALTAWPGQVGVCKDQVLQEKLMCWPSSATPQSCFRLETPVDARCSQGGAEGGARSLGVTQSWAVPRGEQALGPLTALCPSATVQGEPRDRKDIWHGYHY